MPEGPMMNEQDDMKEDMAESQAAKPQEQKTAADLVEKMGEGFNLLLGVLGREGMDAEAEKLASIYSDFTGLISSIGGGEAPQPQGAGPAQPNMQPSQVGGNKNAMPKGY